MNDSKSKDAKEPAESNETWGGPHAQLLMTETGAELEFDCAHGRINSRLKPDSEGNFDIEGTFQREGGPTRSDADSGRPARYVGKIVGDTMTLKVHLTETNQTTEEFSLTRGRNGRLWKCR